MIQFMLAAFLITNDHKSNYRQSQNGPEVVGNLREDLADDCELLCRGEIVDHARILGPGRGQLNEKLSRAADGHLQLPSPGLRPGRAQL